MSEGSGGFTYIFTHLTQEELDSCEKVLHFLANNRKCLRHGKFESIVRLMKALMFASDEEKLAWKISKLEKKDKKKEAKQMQRQQMLKFASAMKKKKQEELAPYVREMRYMMLGHLNEELIERENNSEVQETQEEDVPQLSSKAVCYVCKMRHNTIHNFYDQLCQSCGDYNFSKRNMTCNLQGKYALVTGARVKIGYQVALKLLRNSCHVMITTRFPKDAFLRFSKEKDFESFKDRLEIVALDFRDLQSVVEFCQFLQNHWTRLDILINNAAQTVRRPIAYYENVIQNECNTTILEEHRSIFPHFENLKTISNESNSLVHNMNNSLVNSMNSDLLSKASLLNTIAVTEEDTLSYEVELPRGRIDVNDQQVDYRKTNSWTMSVGQVPIVELVETQTINCVVPFILIQRLLPLMQRHPQSKRYIINVSSMEGIFSRIYKGDKHPHTNMAKASLNMLTRTSADGLAKNYNIYMNAVDTGWVTEEQPFGVVWTQRTVPLDEIDGAMRILDPIFASLDLYGLFFKDYKPYPW